jgi:tRNA nucleotidyltransferase (CCA-adding enzyme)
LFALHRDHLAAPAAEMLANLRERLIEEIRGMVGEWPIGPLHVSLFGSTARGDGGTQSDIDLFVIRAGDVDEDEPLWRDQSMRSRPADRPPPGRWNVC